MVAVARKSLNLSFPAFAAAGVGGAVAAFVCLIPRGTLELWVDWSGLGAVVAAAEPPLGTTARAMLALAAGASVALVTWCMLILASGVSRVRAAKARHVEISDVTPPSVRRADAHPDAPPRPPLRAARDLGTPFLEVRAPEAIETEPFPEPAFEPETQALRPTMAEARASEPVPALKERNLPEDWSQPLSAFDPTAIPQNPIEPPVQPARVRKALRQPLFNPYERIETFELTPTVRSASKPAAEEVLMRQPANADDAEPIAAPETDATIHALLARLERGVERKRITRTAPPPPRAPQPEHGLQDALVSLRNLAMRA